MLHDPEKNSLNGEALSAALAATKFNHKDHKGHKERTQGLTAFFFVRFVAFVVEKAGCQPNNFQNFFLSLPCQGSKQARVWLYK
jgi:hypothetical protein